MNTDGAANLTLAEELLLLAHGPADGKKLCRPRTLEYGLAGAVLAELELRGQVTEDDGRPAVVVPALPPAPDPRLDWALASLTVPGDRPPKTHQWIRAAAKGQEEAVVMGLIERGALTVERQRFAVFRELRYPVGKTDLTNPARGRFEAARQEGFPDPRSRTLAALTDAIGITERLYPGWSGRRDRRPMRRLTRDGWIASAVHRNARSHSSDGTGSGGGDGGGHGCGGHGGHGCGGGCGGGCGS
ncbi:hypothetical protein BLA24_14385 [Streptomyces cinnamoneus]|uniref:Uncharacterized protein n=1 Tax=Streptomyces cinnamoneus TaxID=53446 RepID=A0A2G1XI99_STRCJ|nr:GPP34 family phosphoprotein [Streptomyces cinnamoneus]PHQ50978.1 hypothetical protein BLA24_14385 [Streptomyces cinnamoneus]PPT13800.1 GPP34 family phosphoprotein [Streptomyces cinnamoneus]